MTYIISGHNPRAGLRGGALGDVWGDMMKDPAGTALAQAQKAAQAAADAAAVAVGLKQAPKAPKAKAPALPIGFPTKGGYVPTFGAQAFPTEEKDNTMLYVGGAVAVVAVLALMRRK